MVSDGDLLGRRTEDYRREWWLEMLAGAAVAAVGVRRRRASTGERGHERAADLRRARHAGRRDRRSSCNGGGSSGFPSCATAGWSGSSAAPICWRSSKSCTELSRSKREPALGLVALSRVLGRRGEPQRRRRLVRRDVGQNARERKSDFSRRLSQRGAGVRAGGDRGARRRRRRRSSGGVARPARSCAATSAKRRGAGFSIAPKRRRSAARRSFSCTAFPAISAPTAAA